jgi:hypothetical protein
MDERIAAIFGYDLANIIWPPFLLQRKIIISSSLGPAKLASKRQRGEGVGRCYQQTPGRETPTCHHFVISPHLQTDDIFSLYSKFFQHPANLNG